MQPPNRNKPQRHLRLPMPCLKLTALGRDALLLCGPRPYSLHRLSPGLAADGWPHFVLTEIAQWRTEPPFAEPECAAVHSDEHGDVYAALTFGIVLLYTARTKSAVQVRFERNGSPQYHLALTPSSFGLLGSFVLHVYPLHCLERPVTHKVAVAGTLRCAALRALPDARLASIAWSDKGLTVLVLDQSGNVAHNTFIPASLRHLLTTQFDVVGSEHIVCCASSDGWWGPPRDTHELLCFNFVNKTSRTIIYKGGCMDVRCRHTHTHTSTRMQTCTHLALVRVGGPQLTLAQQLRVHGDLILGLGRRATMLSAYHWHCVGV